MTTIKENKYTSDKKEWVVKSYIFDGDSLKLFSTHSYKNFALAEETVRGSEKHGMKAVIIPPNINHTETRDPICPYCGRKIILEFQTSFKEGHRRCYYCGGFYSWKVESKYTTKRVPGK